MADYLMGTDIGTGGIKSVLMDGEGNVLGSHYVEYRLIIPKPRVLYSKIGPGWAEHKPGVVLERCS